MKYIPMTKSSRYFGLLLAATISLLSGCKAMGPISTDTKREFTFDYQISGKSKDELYSAALTFIAMSYGDSNSVLKITDKDGGLIAGKGMSVWNEFGTNRHTPHELMFMAKEGRARLQLSIPGTATKASFGGVYIWPMPSPGGYDQIVQQFNNFSASLENALEGSPESSNFSNF